MSMTQLLVDELREVAKELAAESRKARRSDRKAKFQNWADEIRAIADELGDD